jgi:hypothetical protein
MRDHVINGAFPDAAENVRYPNDRPQSRQAATGQVQPIIGNESNGGLGRFPKPEARALADLHHS